MIFAMMMFNRIYGFFDKLWRPRRTVKVTRITVEFDHELNDDTIELVMRRFAYYASFPLVIAAETVELEQP